MSVLTECAPVATALAPNVARTGVTMATDEAGGGEKVAVAGVGADAPAARGEFTDYFSELTNIELSKDMETQTDDEAPPKTPDEGEQEIGWLEDAGYSHLVSKFKEGVVVTDDLVSKETSALSRSQAAAVKKRVDTLNATLRKRRKQRHKPHVRDVFAPDSDDATPSMRQTADESPWKRSDTPLSPPKPPPPQRSSLLRTRGGYSLASANQTLSAVDSLTNPGVEILRVQSTNRDAADGGSVGAKGSGGVGGGGTVRSAQRQHLRQQIELVPGQSIDANGLPELVLSAGKLGRTFISDLSAKDLSRIQPLALIELTSLYDSHGVTYIRGKQSKARVTVSESGLFGASLQTMLDHDQKKFPHLKVPLIFTELIKYLEATSLDEEGLLRVPGQVSRMKALRHEWEGLYRRGRLRLVDVPSHDAAGLLKQLVRGLPAPLLTAEYLEAFTQVDKMNELRQKIESLNLLVLLLPEVNRNTLQLLLKFLEAVVDNAHNRMTIKSVAMIMAPNLFHIRSPATRLRAVPSQPNRELEISIAARTSSIVELIVKYQRLLWAVPQCLLFLVRNQYQQDKKRTRKAKSDSIIRFLSKDHKNSTRSTNTSEAFSNDLVGSSTASRGGMIRVTAPQLSKFNATLALSADLTARDVLARFSTPPHASPPTPAQGGGGTAHNGRDARGDTYSEGGESAANGQATMHLYEIGGNIGERRLDEGTNMLTVFQINPDAAWVIRTDDSEPT